MDRHTLPLLTTFSLITLTATSHATPSGLNNIPTADTTRQGTLKGNLVFTF